MHFTVFESMQFCLSLHKSIKVSLICPCLSSREDNFSHFSLPVMHTLKLGGGRFLLFCLQVEW